MSKRDEQQNERITLNFDLFQNELKNYGFKNPIKAYDKLGKILSTCIN